MAHEDYKEMLPALALSALDEPEARALNQHLAECDECRRELASWESTAAALALSASPVEPSPAVRERIMNVVRGEGQSSRVVPFPQDRRKMWTSFGSVGAIAAAVLFVVLILWIVVLWQQNRALRRDNEELASTIHSMNRSNQFVDIVSTPGAKVTELQGSGPAVGATAQLAYDRSGRAMLLANGLPPTPAGKEYQLWFIVGKNPPIPGRTFATDYAGSGALRDDVPQQAMDSAVFAVTLEPIGGNLAPSSPIYLRSGL
ncbi:MAG TPA: anti-sigma factor [Pyrinomonadaceae bacterium]|nr:anti-sigma factor [Pyrinomonadaceae bacterium]